MYTNGYVNQEMIVSQRAYPVRETRWHLLRRSVTQSDGKLRHDVQKRNHRKEPKLPATTWTVLDLTRVAKSHHDGRSKTQAPALRNHSFGGNPITRINSMRRSGTVRIQSTYR